MWIDGIEIERLEENETCYLVDDSYLVITDKKGNIIFTFNLKFKDENTDNLNKDVAQSSILSYDLIRKLQGDYS